MIWLMILFAILAIIFGIWGFAAAAVWAGAKILFYICVVLFVLSVLGGLLRPRTPAGPLP